MALALAAVAVDDRRLAAVAVEKPSGVPAMRALVVLVY